MTGVISPSDTADAPWVRDLGEESPRQRLLRVAMENATRSFTLDANGAQRIDPLARLFDPAFAEKVWYYEHSKIGEMPGQLHSKQVEMLSHQATHRWALWGNQSGKTTLGAVDVALSVLGRHPLQLRGIISKPPFTAWASALSWELWEKILLPELLSWIPPWRIIDSPPPHKKSTKRDIVILADNGTESRITGKAAEQGAQQYQSARVDLVWLDEEHPEAVWDEMQPRLLRRKGRTIATMTPLLGMTWVHGRMYEPLKTGQLDGTRHFYSHAGVIDNPGIDTAAVDEIKEELKHNPSQLESRLYGHFTRPTGAVLPWDPSIHLTETPIAPDDNRLNVLRERGSWYGALDLGKWRFHFQLAVADRDGNLLILDEYFSQNEDDTTRARGIEALRRHWRVPAGDHPNAISIPADCADPKGIGELNDAFELIGSPLRVYAIDGNLKNRMAGVGRVENLMNRGALKVRRGMGGDHQWRLGKNSATTGHPVMGSRWMWEIVNWQYPKMADGRIQKDEPDDKSADGADAMDGLRYLVMQFFPADAMPLVKRRKNPTLGERLQKELEALDLKETQQSDRERFGSALRQ